jgi:eukaryotic-like serine/threonine-protein kinase
MLAPNTFIQNRYLFVRRLGGSAASAVYEAIDINSRANVALKQVTLGTDTAGGRREILKREARRLAELRHPALPSVGEAFVEGDSVFLATEFVPGDDLMTQLERNGRPFPIIQTLRWADQLLDALNYLHSQLPPLIHHDITPRNLKLTPRGQVMLIDFGLSQTAGPSTPQKLVSGQVSPFQFMPPEQVARTGTTTRSDLFALAATLYYLLTGSLPVLAGKRANAIARGQPDPLRPAHDIVPELPIAVSDLLTRALALDPAARPASAADMRAALERARSAPHALPELSGDQPAEPTPTIYTPAPEAQPAEAPPIPLVAGQQPARRIWLVPAIGGAIVLLLLAFLLLRGQGKAIGVTPTATLVPVAPTVAPRFTSDAPAVSATNLPEATAQSRATEPAAVLAQATELKPASAFAGALPIAVTVNGSQLDKVHVVRFVNGSGAAIQAEVLTRTASQIKLSIPALPGPISGEVNYALQLDGVVQKVPALTLRDYRERKPAQGVLADYAYTSRVIADEAGAYASLLAEAEQSSAAVGKLRNGDQLDVLRDDLPEWYQVRISTSAEAAQIGLSGWIERWLIDNQNPPPPPTATPEPTQAVQVFAGRVYSAPTDAAVQCGTAFESSIYGSIESSSGRGISGALVRVVSADGRNTYNVTTGRGGVYSIGGLGCTTWTVRLISVPGAKIQANSVAVNHLNGGRYTSAEVRYRMQK